MKTFDGRTYLHGDAIPWAGYEGMHFCSHCEAFEVKEHFRSRRCKKRKANSPTGRDLARKELTEWRRLGRGGDRAFNRDNLFLMQGRRGD